MLLVKSFIESGMKIYNDGSESAVKLMISTLESYIVQKCCSKLVFNHLNYNRRTRFYEWAREFKEFSLAFCDTDSGIGLFKGFYYKQMDRYTYMFMINRANTQLKNSNQAEELETIVYIVGNNHKTYSEKLTQFLLKPAKVKPTKHDLNYTGNIFEVTPTGLQQSCINYRALKSIFSPQKDEVIAFLDSWNKLGAIYQQYQLIHKTGVLLYGAPGTGKTSFAKAIANYCKKDIIVVDLSLSVESIKTSLRKYDGKVILFEDIDCFIKNRNVKLTADEESKLNFLLGILDGIYSTNNCIYIATTNHIDKIDEAFKRPGRFNMVLEITDLNQKEAEEMCAYYELPTKVLKNIGYPVNPSYLQFYLLEKRVAQIERTSKCRSAHFKQDIQKIADAAKTQSLPLPQSKENAYDDLDSIFPLCEEVPVPSKMPWQYTQRAINSNTQVKKRC